MLVLSCLFLSVGFMMAQTKVINGTVVDENGGPAIGASVIVKGSSPVIGTVADLDGKFSITLPQGKNTLVFTLIGMSPLEVQAAPNMKVILKSDDYLLDEVVVTVGYATQKKVNLTGSVATVGSEKLANRPAMNLSSTLSGLAPGVRVTQGSGNPGSESVSILVRGTGSFNNSAPLVLVDGVVADMSVVNTEDVESISILKDAASAAIYGSRAANGVILVTTKKGKSEAPRVTFSTIFAREKASTNLKFLSDTADWMELHNMSILNNNPKAANVDYGTDVIDAWRAANANPNGIYTDPMTGNKIPNWLAYPNTDWAQIMYQPSYYQKYNVGVSGGSNVSTYMLSLGYQNNPGTLDNTSMQRFNIRANVETKIANFITLGTQTYATKEFKDPGDVSMGFLFQAFPGINPIYDGKFGTSEDPNMSPSNNILASVAGTGGQIAITRINTSWYTNIQFPLKGLVGEAKINYNEYIRDDETYTNPNPTYSFRESLETPKNTGTSLANATTYRASSRTNSYTANLILRYNNTFGKHSVGGLFGYEQFRTEGSAFNATKKGLLDWNVTDITSASDMHAIGGTAKSEYAMISYFGRANYTYDGKYMLEANFRSDQSSKFAPGHRGNFFPSVSLGWRVSEEKFFAPLKNTVNYLKLKASYGTLGNTVGGNYDWQALYRKVNAVLGETATAGVVQTSIQNLGLSWEKLTTYNVGLEAYFLKQRLNVEVDAYYRETSDILASGKIYMTMGNITAPMENTATMGNRGIEVAVNWHDKIGKFKYGIGVNGSYNTNKVIDFKGKLVYAEDTSVKDIWGNPTMRYTNLADVSTGGDTRRVEGHRIDEWYLARPYSGNGTYTNTDGSVNPKGGPKDGMIRTKADLEWVKSMIAAGYSFNTKTVGRTAANIWYGTLIFDDLNGDGKYGDNNDREFTGKSATPKFTFGLTLSAEWKGFDLSMIWSGRAGSYHYINNTGANGSIITNKVDAIAADAWNKYYIYDPIKADLDYDNYDPATDPTANVNGKYPRLTSATSTMQTSTFYLYNTSFLKLKSLQIGYTLPKRWIAPAKINNLRVFFSGENLLTIKKSDFPGVDPELGSGLSVYPIATMYSGGISLSF